MCSSITSFGDSLEPFPSLGDTGSSSIRDELTGFLTRQSLLRLMKSSAIHAAHPRRTLVKVELSRFELLGIGQGPDRADIVIARTARRMKRLFPSAIAFARMGEARFAMLLASQDGIADEVARLQEFLQRPMAIDGDILVLRLHIGVALVGDVARAGTGLVQAAGAALYHAIAQNRGVVVFQPDMLAEARNNQTLENDLRVALALKSTDIHDALNNAEFLLLYQPIINNVSGMVHGFEALVRWNHPRLGQISPAVLIPMAEQLGVMPLLGAWIIRKAMVDAMTWPANRDGSLPTVSINLSARQFDQPEALMAVINSAINHAGIHPGRISFEMTESNYLSRSVKPHLDALHAMGCALAMDDFGTGYSALAALVELPLDYLKIDRSLVVDLNAPDNRLARRARRLMRSVIGLAEGLGLHPVVEGVETAEQLRTVCALGAELIQGNYHHRPMPASEARTFMRRPQPAGQTGE